MSAMFLDATAFDQPLSNWDMGSVIATPNMFDGASSFNQPLDNWNTAAVTDMSTMFLGATAFNQPLNSWNVSSVADLFGMFDSATVFNQNLCSWGGQLSSTANIFEMFIDAASCPTGDEPDLSATPPGPFCYPCTCTGNSKHITCCRTKPEVDAMTC